MHARPTLISKEKAQEILTKHSQALNELDQAINDKPMPVKSVEAFYDNEYVGLILSSLKAIAEQSDYSTTSLYPMLHSPQSMAQHEMCLINLLSKGTKCGDRFDAMIAHYGKTGLKEL